VPTEIVNDLFTEAADTLLTSHTPDTGDPWVEEENGTANDPKVLTTFAAAAHDGTDNNAKVIVTSRPDPSVVEYDVEGTIDQADSSDDDGFFFVARYTGTTSYYFAGGAVNSYDIYIQNSGVTSLACVAEALDVADYKFEIKDATKKFFHDATEKLSTTDNNLTSAGSCGLGWGALPASTWDPRTDWKLDDYIVTETGAAAGGPCIRTLIGVGCFMYPVANWRKIVPRRNVLAWLGLSLLTLIWPFADNDKGNS